MEVKINFIEDWRLHLLQTLKRAGYRPDVTKDVEYVSYIYHNVLRREVSMSRRRVHEASGFSCPSENRKGYHLLKQKIEAGLNVNPHLSESLRDLNYEDSMLNDWGIYHFHLGEKLNKRGFVKRTGPLVYAYITQTDFYVLGIFGHGKWTWRNLIRIIHKNWPSAIEQYRLKNVIRLSRYISDADLKRLRASGLNVPIEISPGVIYIGPGGGMATSKGSINARWQADRVLDGIERLQEYVRGKASEYLSVILGSGRSVNDVLEFQLVVSEAGFSALEKTSKVLFKLPQVRF